VTLNICLIKLNLGRVSDQAQGGDQDQRGCHRWCHHRLRPLPGINFTNILLPTSVLILFRQKITKPNCN